MKHRKRPAQHYRRILTKRGRKRVLVNRGVPKARKRRRNFGVNFPNRKEITEDIQERFPKISEKEIDRMIDRKENLFKKIKQQGGAKDLFEVGIISRLEKKELPRKRRNFGITEIEDIARKADEEKKRRETFLKTLQGQMERSPTEEGLLIDQADPEAVKKGSRAGIVKQTADTIEREDRERRKRMAALKPAKGSSEEET